jgi:hypothetical protein
MIQKWKESKESWHYQRNMTPCAQCGRPVLPSLAISEGENVYCSECVKTQSLQSDLESLEPREGESMDEWMVRWKRYRQRCINLELDSIAPKKRVVFPR